MEEIYSTNKSTIFGGGQFYSDIELIDPQLQQMQAGKRSFIMLLFIFNTMFWYPWQYKSDCFVFLFQINWMKYTPPNKESQPKHTDYFKETFKYRRSFIEDPSNTKSITDIIAEFPRFKDIPELVRRIVVIPWCILSVCNRLKKICMSQSLSNVSNALWTFSFYTFST